MSSFCCGGPPVVFFPFHWRAISFCSLTGLADRSSVIWSMVVAAVPA